MRCSVFIATSADGFIAREDGGIDWLPDIDIASGQDYGYSAFMASVDAIVMGRHSYDKVLTLGEWSYGDKPVYVLTSRPWRPAAHVPATVQAMAGDPRHVVNELAGRGHEHLYVDGGMTIQSFLREDLIQRLIVTRVPVLLGKGRPLFGPLHRDVRLRHVSTRAYPNGLAQTEYEVIWSVLETRLA